MTMHKQVAGIRICIGHLFPIMLPITSAPSVCLVPSTYFPSSAPLTPSTFSSSSTPFALPMFSALSVPLLHTNLASIYHHRKCCLSACPMNDIYLLRNWPNFITLPSEGEGVRQGVSKVFKALITNMVLGILVINMIMIIYTSKISK